MPIPTQAAWIRATSVTFRMRSDLLKAVDRAIHDWNMSKTTANLEKIEQKLLVYITSKGAQWREDDRNKHHAVSNLYQELQIQLHGADEVSLTLEELHEAGMAFETWAAARKGAAKRLFTDTQFVLKGSSVTRPTSLKGVSTSEVALSLNNVRTIAESADSLIKSALHTVAHPGVLQEVLDFCHASGLFQTFVAELTTHVLPYVGLASSGYSVVSNGIKAAYNEYEKSVRLEAAPHIDAGDPRAALEALGVIIDRDQRKNLDQAAMAAAQLATGAVLTALDISGATASVTNAAFAIAKLTYRIRLICREFEEKNKANVALADAENIDLDIFKTCPLLGCYLLVCAETSTLIIFLPGFGGVGWMDDVEDIVRTYLAPVQNIAMSYLNSARFDLVRKSDGSHLETRLYVDPGLIAKAKKLKDGGWSIKNVGRWATLSPEEYKKRFGTALPADFHSRIQGRDRFSDERDALERRKKEVWDRFNNVNRPRR